MKDKKIIGVTGVYCAGKNNVSLLLNKRGFPVLDVDKLGHQVIETEKGHILARFGEDILDSEGLIDRKRLGVKVFDRPEELAALEEIIHPIVNRETLEWINAQKENTCFINAALLHRSSAFESLDAVIVVEAPFLARLFRAKKRDRLPWMALLKRFRSQANFTAQYFKGKTDIYRVSNPSLCSKRCCIIGAIFRYFGHGKHGLRNRLEKRIDEILSLLGM